MAVDDPVDPEAATLQLPALGAAGSVESAALAAVVGLDPPALARADMEQLTGLPHVELVRWWRAMGFAEVPEELRAFGPTDVDMARRLASLVGSGTLSQEDVLRLARVLGASFSRIAKAQASVLDEVLAAPGDGGPEQHVTRLDQLLDALDDERGRAVLELLEDSVLYVWRRHLLAALGRWVGVGEGEAVQAVAFADVSDFSGLTKSLQPEDISRIVDDFEANAFDVVSGRGGRVVKMIGDEVMFVTDDVASAVDACLDLVERLAAAEHPLQLHCGIAYGPTVTIGGDVFGPTANLASRLTDVARRGKVVLPRDASAELAEREDLVLRPVRRVFELKGVGRTRMCTVGRRPVPAAPAEVADTTEPLPADVPQPLPATPVEGGPDADGAGR